MSQPAALDQAFELSRPFSLRLTLGPLRHGRFDPTMRIEPGLCWRASRFASGIATLLIEETVGGVRARAWGDGAEDAIASVPTLIGEHQTDADFETDNPLVHDLHRELAGMRVPQSNEVVAELLPAIIEQRVTGMEAKHTYRRIIRRWGERAPGPLRDPLMVAPTPQTLMGIPSWALHSYGVERKRAEVIRLMGRHARRLEEATTMNHDDALTRLQALPGIGQWTAAETAYTALGDADAFSIGDYHLKNVVSWALASEPRGTDERMVELLEPFRGQRGRVARMLAIGNGMAPKYGPRYTPLPLAAM